MSPERIYLRHYNDSQTSPIDPHTLRLWRLGDGDTSTMIVPDGDLAEWVFSIKPGSRADAFVSGFNAAVSMLGKYQGPTAPSVAVAWERYKKSLPAPGSAPVELTKAVDGLVTFAMHMGRASDPERVRAAKEAVEAYRAQILGTPAAAPVERAKERITYKPGLGLVGEQAMAKLTALDDIKHLLADIRSNVKLDEGLSYRVEDAISILETGYSAFHRLPEPIEDAPAQGVEAPKENPLKNHPYMKDTQW